MGEERGGGHKGEKFFFAFLDELDHSKHFFKNQLKKRCEKVDTFFFCILMPSLREAFKNFFVMGGDQKVKKFSLHFWTN